MPPFFVEAGTIVAPPDPEWMGAAGGRTATAMIRITIHHTDRDLMFKLEGSLSGAWVGELEACWRDARPMQQGRTLRVDLRGLCQVDASGRELMARLYEDGAEFLASGCVMRELLREIAAAAGCRTSNERIRS